MTQKVGIRDIVRNFSMLDNYDYVEIEDKKSKKCKGLFVSDKFAQEVKKFLDRKLEEEKEEKLNRLMEFAGKFELEDRFKNLSAKEIREKIALEKYGN